MTRSEPIYLDHAATTPVPPQVRDVIGEALARWANPSSQHAAGRAARAALEQARARVADALGWRHDVLFTGGATEAVALAWQRSRGRRKLASAAEHPALIRLAGDALIAVDGMGLVDPAQLPSADLVAVQQVNNETGVIQPLTEIAEAVRGAGGLLLADCAQGAGKLALPDADLIVIAGHKLGAPSGIGALLVRDLAVLEATGGQERGYRPGTENLPYILGLATALEAERGWIARAQDLRDWLERELRALGAEVVAEGAERLPTIGAYRLPGVNASLVLIRCDVAGIAISAGSACSSGSMKPSHVLLAMGMSEVQAREVFRVSIGRETTQGELAALVAVIRAIAERGEGGMIYLDYQATTPLAPEARAAMLPWLGGPESAESWAAGSFANPHSPHRPGRAAAAVVEHARDQVAALLPTGGRVIFTSGATEAINLAIQGRKPRQLLVSQIEHAAVLDTAQACGVEVHTLPVDAQGLVDAEAPIPPGTDLVALMQVNNEIGTIQPVASMARRAHACGALLLCDAVQGAGKLAAPAEADLIAISAHKLYGPKGIGALWVRDGVELAPLMHGGGQEGGLRSGTLSPALCAGFGAAAGLCARLWQDDAQHVENLWELARKLLPEWTLNGSATARWQGNLNLRREGLDVARLMSDCRTIAFSAGSACASGSGRPSHVLRALGLLPEQAKSSIRIGFGRYTSAGELAEALTHINAAAAAQGI